MKKKTSIGGQAVLEGVMMRGNTAMATAMRNSNGNIVIDSERVTSTADKSVWYRIPVVRGVFNFVAMMISGIKTLMSSSEVFGEEEEPSKTEKWFAKTFKIDLIDVVIGFALILGLALSIGLFFVLPQALGSLLFKIPALGALPSVVKNLITGVIRIIIFLGYLMLVSLMKDIKRVFMYHGAEHKTINCYESGEELTIANVMKASKEHNRCGTTYLVIIMVISVLVFSLLGWSENFLVRLGLRLLMLPVVAGISYELLKLFAKYDNWFTYIVRKPGLWVQKLTTKEPTEDMVEVAILAFNRVLAMDNDPNYPSSDMEEIIAYDVARKNVEAFAGGQVEMSDIDWCFAEKLGVGRSEIALVDYMSIDDYKSIVANVRRILDGEPFAYVVGNANFYGYELKVNSNVLIPRPETELLVERAISYIKDDSKILDVCTGSGAIAIAISKLKNVAVTACDISPQALEVAKENAKRLGADVTFVESDLFQNIEGSYDIITINPPYIPTADIANLDKNVVNYEPHLALDGGMDGLDLYRRIASDIDQKLVGGGILLMECGINQSEQIAKIFEEKCSIVDIIKDYSDIDRIVVARGKNV